MERIAIYGTGSALHVKPSNLYRVADQDVLKLETDGKHSNLRSYQEKKESPIWKSAMAFRSKRVVDCSAVLGGEKVSTKACSSQQNESTGPVPSASLKLNATVTRSWSLWRKASSKAESEDECLLLSGSQSSTVAESERNLHSGTIFACRPLKRDLLSHVGRPLSAHPLLAMCVPEQGTCAKPTIVRESVLPRQLKRRACWSSDEKCTYTKRKVSCEPEDKQTVLDAALALSKLRVPSPPSTTSPFESSPSSSSSSAMPLPLPPPPFRLWQS